MQSFNCCGLEHLFQSLKRLVTRTEYDRLTEAQITESSTFPIQCTEGPDTGHETRQNSLLHIREGPDECTEENRSKADFGGVTFKLKVQVEVTPAREEEQHK